MNIRAMLAILLMAAVGGGCWWFLNGRLALPEAPQAAPDANPPPMLAGRLEPPGFEERAEAAGLDFVMQFLPQEQGENFKVNLYDHGSGLAIGDYDGDGWDDIYFVNQLGGNALFRNRGDGTFHNVNSTAGDISLADRICVAATFADYDQDGDQDLFVTSTRGGNVLLRNDGCGRFEDVTREAGLERAAHSQAGFFLDYELDGDLDLLVVHTASWTGEHDRQAGYFKGPYYFHNHFPRQTYVALERKGVRSNRDAAGAVVRLISGEEILVRQVETAGRYLAQSFKALHFGLRPGQRADRLEITWPGGTRQTLPVPELGRRHVLVKPLAMPEAT